MIAFDISLQIWLVEIKLLKKWELTPNTVNLSLFKKKQDKKLDFNIKIDYNI